LFKKTNKEPFEKELNKQNDLNLHHDPVPSKLDSILKLMDKEIDESKQKAEKYRKDALSFRTRFFILRIPIIVLGIILPFVIAFQASYPNIVFIVLSSTIALLVAIFSGLDTFLKWGEVSAGYLSTSYSIQKILREFIDKKEKINLEVETNTIEIKKGIDEALKAIEIFRRDRNQIIARQDENCVSRIKTSIIETQPDKSNNTS